jgi:hypothetical protein
VGGKARCRTGIYRFAESCALYRTKVRVESTFDAGDKVVQRSAADGIEFGVEILAYANIPNTNQARLHPPPMKPSALRFLRRIVKESTLQETWNVMLSFTGHLVYEVLRLNS